MKLVFTPEELAWLDKYMSIMASIAHKEKHLDGGALMRVTNKARRKFSPSALFVTLNSKERTIIKSIVTHRLQTLSSSAQTTSEGSVLTGILNKVCI